VSELYQPKGSTAGGAWSVVTRMRYPRLRILDLAPGGSHRFGTVEEEALVLPLAGSCAVSCGDKLFELTGRGGVFDVISDFCYLPRNSEVTIDSAGGGRFAVPAAVADRDLPARYVSTSDIQVELRGAGVCSRQVNNLAAAGGFECASLIVVEVLTPGGNWSSYPPHKHDEHRPGETELEEIYYFEVRGGGVGYQRVFGTAQRPIDVLAEVRSGDVVQVPHGWHGPSIAVPGYDLYYLNVMAGPERAWRFCVHPDYAWVRGTWAEQAVDPRLPLTGGERA
jgi:5-deoxy-glucuronate isomerase